MCFGPSSGPSLQLKRCKCCKLPKESGKAVILFPLKHKYLMETCAALKIDTCAATSSSMPHHIINIIRLLGVWTLFR